MSERILNEEQKAAVEHADGPLLIIAGAGTGKTTVITERIKYLILRKNIPASKILALTFTEKAALEMETRVDEMLPYGYTQMWIQTFHSFCDRVLRNEAIHIGLTPGFTLLTEAQALLFLRKNLFEFDLDYFRPLGNPMKFLQGMLQHFSRLKDDDISPEEYIKYAEKIANTKLQFSNTHNGKSGNSVDDLTDTEKNSDKMEEEEIKKIRELAYAFQKYETLKNKEGVMDFSDLVSNTLKLFRSRKNVLREYQEKFQYILVDEFQDTNFAQNEMAILLAGKKQNITGVADDDQSIYRWRGAAIANVMQFRKHFPKAKIITLTKNYRSTQTILDSAYQLIQHNNPYRLEVQEKIAKKLTSARAVQGEPIELIHTGRVDEEAEAVVNEIRNEQKKHNRKYSDFAILVRANDHALPFQRALERAKIPYQFLGPGRLFQQEEIKDLIAYLHVLANFEDTASLYRVLTMDILDISARDIAAIMNFAKKENISLFEAIERIDEVSVNVATREKVQRLVDMIKRHLALIPKEVAGQILYYFFEDSGLLGYYLDPRSAKTERQAQNIANFFERLQSFAAENRDASVFAVVDWIDLSMELGESPLAAETDWTENNAVNILTVHSSKGLEFPVVFVVNLVMQRFPSRDRKEQIPIPQELIKEQLPETDENLQEERRLFYVAMTRARDKLYLTAAKSYGEGKRERKLSPFVYEALGETYVNKILEREKVEQASEQLSLLEVLKPIAKSKDENDSKDLSLAAFPKTYTVDYISYSQIQTFDVCPLHYKLKYILKFPSPPSPALSFGITIHALLKTIYQLGFGRQKISEEMLDRLIDEFWRGEGYSSKAHEQAAKKSAKQILLSYMAHNAQEGRLPEATELSFQFMLNDRLKVLGRFDRIDKLEGNTIEIIDYKTGENVPDERKLNTDLQLSLYALAATMLNDDLFRKKPEEILLTLYYVEKNKRLSTVRTKEQLEEAKELILKKVDEITHSDFRCRGGMICENCEYKILCSTYASK